MSLFTSQGVGQYASGQSLDKHVVVLDRLYRADSTKRPVLWCHSAGGDATEPILPTNNALPHLRAIASLGVPIISFDARGGYATSPNQHWGNDYAQSRVTDAVAWLRSKYGAHPSAAPVMIGVSMGGLLALNYMRSNAVQAAALLYPVVDLQAVHDGTGGAATGGAATTEGAYGGSLAGFNSAVAAHNPQQNQSAYQGQAVKMWYSDSDVTVGTANQQAFAQAVSTMGVTKLPGAGHADMLRVSPNDIVTFLQNYL